MQKQQWEFWIDRGGTFTDIVARRPDGHLICHKLLSENPAYYSDAIIHGIREVLHLKKDAPIPVDKISVVKIGTTIATNALLERKGERVLLAITKGFGDALRIGYQNRPELFALNINLPPLLYDAVVEIEERIDAHGNVLCAVDSDVTYKALQHAYADGFRAIAIVLMHGYRYTQHEERVKHIAKSIGFEQISVSHEVIPVMKLVIRGDTTVTDAYLSPVLQRYTKNLQQALGPIPLFFMQSNGGLATAKLFQGKDSIFSGPAGGVVGMVKTSVSSGFNRVIGFDMGGTSTDVSHFAGEYERTYTCNVGGVNLHTPMMLIHTIAAGGGSILHFDGQRYLVGPDSAGANPGPACYRRGGPLTITDCNVLLGKIQADFFPKVFGAKRNQAIDVELVRKKFNDLIKKITRATHEILAAEQVAEGYLKIAVENMANAIKKISVQRGYDVSKYVLNCFGGAAGQHACLVADTLGINKILIHPLAGVLSAYGIGLAETRRLKEQAIEKVLVRSTKSLLNKSYKTLKQKILNELISQGELAKRIVMKELIHLRYEGSDTSLVVEFNSIGRIKSAFQAKHCKLFGFASRTKPLIVEAVSVEAIVRSKSIKKFKQIISKTRFSQKIPLQRTVSVFTQNTFHKAPVYDRQDLMVGDCIKGCAIIKEANATTVVEPGWQAEITEKQDLILSRHQPLAKKVAVTAKVNPVMLEVFNNRFMNIAEQMGEVLKNTASSVNIKERLDFSCAIFDAQGELVANAPHMPVHLGAMSESVKSILQQRHGTMHAQDVYVLNAPYRGGSHLPDITVITPVFDKYEKKILFLLASRGHHADIGGITPGSIPASSKVVEEEGVVINNFKIMNRGHFLEKATIELLTTAPYPARNPKQNLEDFKAQIAANENGVHELQKLVEQFGLKVVHAYMQHIRDNARSSVERLLTRLTGGSFCYSLDDGSKINVVLSINAQKKTACIDFTGSALQHSGNFNAPVAVCKAAVLYVLRCLIAENIPLNSGCLEPIEIIIPSPSILNPNYPAAVVAGNVETSQCIVDTLLGAVQAVAASQGTCNNFTFGNAKFQYYETICGGSGAGPGFDGTSAVHTHMTNTRLTDPEILEWRFPILLEQFSIRHGSGGAGKYQGGDGVIRRIRFLENMIANIISSHRKIPPYGLQGGAPGQVGHNWIQRANGQIEELGSSAEANMQPGDVFVIETPGGGGFGKNKFRL